MLKLREFLQDLEGESTSVDKLAEKLAASTGKEDPKPALEPEKEEPVKEAEVKNTPAESPTEEVDLMKMAEIQYAMGQIYMQGVFDKQAELAKEAVGVVGKEPDAQAHTGDPVQLSREELPSTIAGLIAQLTNGERAAGPNGYVAGPAGIIGGATGRQPTTPVPAEAKLQAESGMKTGAQKIVADLYDKYFPAETQGDDE